jgi:hypothetical protein
LNRVERAKAVLQNPKSEWQVIEDEPGVIFGMRALS